MDSFLFKMRYSSISGSGTKIPNAWAYSSAKSHRQFYEGKKGHRAHVPKRWYASALFSLKRSSSANIIKTHLPRATNIRPTCYCLRHTHTLVERLAYGLLILLLFRSGRLRQGYRWYQRRSPRDRQTVAHPCRSHLGYPIAHPEPLGVLLLCNEINGLHGPSVQVYSPKRRYSPTLLRSAS